MMINLTGKTRYRTRSRFLACDIVVLQVEEKTSGQLHWSNDGGRVECETLPDSLRWRDATIYDLQELNLL